MSEKVPPGPALGHGVGLPTYMFTETDSLFPCVLRSDLEKSMKAVLTNNIKEIKKEELSDWISLKKNEFWEVFKGKYYQSPVAIKVFNNVQSRNPG